VRALPHSRQELFHLIRVGQIKTFDELLAQHGQGLGCDICKPAAASIFASCWNDFVLQPELAPLQDSNDYFLGNIQKDGSYSVVPRMPGGEVTPEGLIAVGQVAKKYGLYTKITGGQRVDLFGARVEQLPLIWEELIAAGFESGHAYGKSLRTVKSCVGSTWCRYGVDDSTGLAIALENRYKGLRAPHKIKFGVSGCTRECAEAQGKDVGIIATDKGWNLYVCGNGGMKPRHAELLASDLTKDALIRLIDRFLMFYVRTADRLQRTSTWRDNLEGGLDYLKGVLLNDSLGLAAELEAQMQQVVDTYQCEWKTAVTTPAVRQRFRSFVNSAQPDEHIVFVQERGQIRPARPEERAGAAPRRPPISPSDPGAPNHGHPRLRLDRRLRGRRHPAGHRRLRPRGRAAHRHLPRRSAPVLRHRQRGPEGRRQRALARAGGQPGRAPGGGLAAVQAPHRPAHRRLPGIARVVGAQPTRCGWRTAGCW
jgi:nitrite reductase (NADH) large subunit